MFAIPQDVPAKVCLDFTNQRGVSNPICSRRSKDVALEYLNLCPARTLEMWQQIFGVNATPRETKRFEITDSFIGVDVAPRETKISAIILFGVGVCAMRTRGCDNI